MNKKINVLYFLFLLSLLVCLPAGQALAEGSHNSRVVDGADLLNDAEEEDLRDLFEEISERQEVDVVLVTVDSLEGKKPRDYADDFYDANGYGYGSDADGILLLISMEERDYWISTTGYGIDVFTDAGIAYIAEQFLPDLSDGRYFDAFVIFGKQCDAFITQANKGEPYDEGNMPKEAFDWKLSILVSLGVGALIAFLTTAVLRGQLKSVIRQKGADNYFMQDSFAITNSKDWILYKDVKMTRRSSSSGSSGGSSTHTGSSGSSHGGGGGKF